VLAKIEALIARAAHPDTPIEEARTSAVIAAKLIREHEVVLVEKGGGRFYPRDIANERPIVDVSDILDMIFRNRPHRPRPPPPPPPKKRRSRGPKTRQEKPVRCPHGVFLGANCPACRSDKEEARPTACPHGKQWPTCEICWKRDFFGDQEFQHRRVWTATCPTLMYQQHIPCACCGGRIVGGDKMCWVGGEAVSVNSKITHERCVAHWSASECMRCGKRTDT
jgi:hypothetical protein